MQDLLALPRCHWAQHSHLEAHYHDVEWGVPTHDEQILFEFLLLEAAQAGLSWSTILKKREGYRDAFAGFDPEKVAHFDEARCQALLLNPNIVRHRQKIQAAVQNAHAFLRVQEQFGSFDAFLWRFVDGVVTQNAWPSHKEVPVHTPTSDTLSKELKKRGFAFVGPTICYSFMQAVGLVNDHTIDCFRWHDLQSTATTAHTQLLSELQDKQASIRAAAVDKLGELAATHAIVPLMALLDDKDEAIRVRVVRSLRQIGERNRPEVFPALLLALKNPIPAVRRAAIVAMGKLQAERSLAPLLEMLQDPDERVRSSAMLTLGEMGNTQALPALLALQQQELDSTNTNTVKEYIDYVIRQLSEHAQ